MKKYGKIIFFLTLFQTVSGRAARRVTLPLKKTSQPDSELEQFSADVSARKPKKIKSARRKRKYPSQILEDLKIRTADLEEQRTVLEKERIALKAEKKELLFAWFLRQVEDIDTFTHQAEKRGDGFPADISDLGEELKQLQELQGDSL